MFIDSPIHLTHSLFEGTVPCIVGSKEMERIKYMDNLQMIKEFRDSIRDYVVIIDIEGKNL